MPTALPAHNDARFRHSAFCTPCPPQPPDRRPVRRSFSEGGSLAEGGWLAVGEGGLAAPSCPAEAFGVGGSPEGEGGRPPYFTPGGWHRGGTPILSRFVTFCHVLSDILTSRCQRTNQPTLPGFRLRRRLPPTLELRRTGRRDKSARPFSRPAATSRAPSASYHPPARPLTQGKDIQQSHGANWASIFSACRLDEPQRHGAAKPQPIRF